MLLFRQQDPIVPTSDGPAPMRYTLRVCKDVSEMVSSWPQMEFDVSVTASPADPCCIRVGPDTAEPCVLLLAYDGDDVLILEGVGFDPGCCCGGGMPRGERGTVLMLQAALRFAVQEACPGRASVALMDVSSRKPGNSASERCQLSCSDVHILKDPAMRSWYEEHLQATVDPSKAGSLAAVRAALSARIDASGTCTEAAFEAACVHGAKLAGIWPWLRQPERRAALLGMFRSAAGGSCNGTSQLRGPGATGATWGDLVRSMISGLGPSAGDEHGDSADCPFVLKLLAAVLGGDRVCPGWVSSRGWGWAIAAEAVERYAAAVTWDVL